MVTALNGVDGARPRSPARGAAPPADETKSGTWSRTGAGPATLTGGADQILLTSTCSVTEDDPATPPSPGDPSYAWGAKTIGGRVTLTAAAAERHPHGQQPGRPGHRHLRGHQERRGRRAGHRVRRRRLHLHLHLLRCRPPRSPGRCGRAGETVQVGTSHPQRLDAAPSSETGRPASITPYDWDDVTITRDVHHLQTPPRSRCTPRTRSASAPSPPRCSKVVDDPDGGFVGDPDFQVSLVCRLNGNTTTYGPEAVKADGTVSFPGILRRLGLRSGRGADRRRRRPADASYAWGLPTFSEEQELADLRGSYVFTVVNHVERALRRRSPWRSCSTTPTTWSRPDPHLLRRLDLHPPR